MNIRRQKSRQAPWDLESTSPLSRWRVWDFGVRPWTPCVYTRLTLLPEYYNLVLTSFSFGCLNVGVACQVVRIFTTFAPCLEHVCAGGGGGG